MLRGGPLLALQDGCCARARKCAEGVSEGLPGGGRSEGAACTIVKTPIGIIPDPNARGLYDHHSLPVTLLWGLILFGRQGGGCLRVLSGSALLRLGAVTRVC